MKKVLLVALLIFSGCLPKIWTIDSHIEFAAPLPQGATTAAPLRGPDILALARHDCSMIQKELDPNSAIGVLDGPFGDPRPCLRQLIASGKVRAVRIHLGDGTVNNHVCSAKEQDLSYTRDQAIKWNAFAAHHPNVKFYGSPWLEFGNCPAALVNSWFSLLRGNAPLLTRVCSNIGGYCPSNVLHEVHGNGYTPEDIRSNDGQSIFDSDSPKYLSSARELLLGWSYCMNGRVSGEHPGDPVPPPMNRVNWCSQAEIRQVIRLLRDPEPTPLIAGCQNITPPNISKTNAEFYGINHDDGRGNKPMLILSKRYGQMSIQTLQGKEIGCMNCKLRDCSYIGGGWRTYEGSCSGKTPTQLQDLLGSEWGKVVSGSDCYLWNAIRRLGIYH